MKQIRKRLTYANVMSSIAVFLVIGGATAFAALGKNSVGTKQLKKNSVTTAKIKKNSVTTAKIKKNSVVTAKIKNNAINTAKIADASVTNSKLAAGAVTGDKLAAGAVSTTSITGASLIPRAYGYVLDEGKTKAGFTENLPNATVPAEGEYCFDLSFNPKHAQATVAGDSEPNDLASVILAGASELVDCPAGTDLEVQTWDTEVDELEDEDFFVVVW